MEKYIHHAHIVIVNCNTGLYYTGTLNDAHHFILTTTAADATDFNAHLPKSWHTKVHSMKRHCHHKKTTRLLTIHVLKGSVVPRHALRSTLIS